MIGGMSVGDWSMIGDYRRVIDGDITVLDGWSKGCRCGFVCCITENATENARTTVAFAVAFVDVIAVAYGCMCNYMHL